MTLFEMIIGSPDKYTDTEFHDNTTFHKLHFPNESVTIHQPMPARHTLHPGNRIQFNWQIAGYTSCIPRLHTYNFDTYSSLQPFRNESDIIIYDSMSTISALCTPIFSRLKKMNCLSAGRRKCEVVVFSHLFRHYLNKRRIFAKAMM